MQLALQMRHLDLTFEIAHLESDQEITINLRFENINLFVEQTRKFQQKNCVISIILQTSNNTNHTILLKMDAREQSLGSNTLITFSIIK